ncbi:MAG: hypothetical protein UV38_C0003G0172 [candidate division TM6 bacterium GW2011_GWE2_42_60]|nr:MAG: hypothetical protein UV38_C0003G0172 [candidate division TM6 bacterium GW2011_GWE2_42_60]
MIFSTSTPLPVHGNFYNRVFRLGHKIKKGGGLGELYLFWAAD